jgi:hypothetical protein
MSVNIGTFGAGIWKRGLNEMNIVLATSIPLVENNVVHAYPNPFGQQIYLSSNENTEFSPYDLRGIKVMQQAIKPVESLLGDPLASGLY